MARLNVNPSRMELQNLKKRLQTAKKGHHFLKNKSDEMVRQFMNYITINKSLRIEVDNQLSQALRLFIFAANKENKQIIEDAISLPCISYQLTAGITSIMGQLVPQITLSKGSSIVTLPYSFLSGNSRLDKSLTLIGNIFEKLIRLAEVEKICDMLAEDIQKNKRRINALEFVLIPNIEQTIKLITMKLDENERNNLIRLMKVKEKIAKV